MGRSTKVSLQYSMNKLLLVALLGFVLIALSVGEEENNESSLQAVETEVEQIREVRDADPGRRERKTSLVKGRSRAKRQPKKEKRRRAGKTGEKGRAREERRAREKRRKVREGRRKVRERRGRTRE